MVSGIRSIGGIHCRSGVAIQEQELNVQRIAQHSHFGPFWEQHLRDQAGASLSGLHGPNIVHTRLSTSRIVAFTTFGVYDRIKLPYHHAEATFLNNKFDVFFQLTGITKHDLWGHLTAPKASLSSQTDTKTTTADNEKEYNIWNARLFPINFVSSLSHNQFAAFSPPILHSCLWMQHLPFSMPTNDHKSFRLSSSTVRVVREWRTAPRISLQDLMHISSPTQEFAWRDEIAFRLDLITIEDVLHHKLNQSITHLVKKRIHMPM